MYMICISAWRIGYIQIQDDTSMIYYIGAAVPLK